MRLPRMTAVRWMVAVAVIIALFYGCLGGVLLWRRHQYFLARARDYTGELSRLRAMQRRMISDWEKADARYRDQWFARHEDLMAMVAVTIEYMVEMASKYRGAARYPWLSVEHELPEPW